MLAQIGLSLEQRRLWFLVTTGQRQSFEQEFAGLCPKQICTALIRTAQGLNWYRGMQGGSNPYLCSEDEAFLASWAYDHYENLRAVKTSEIQHKAFELANDRLQCASMLLFNSGHPILSEKIRRKKELLDTPTRSWVNKFCQHFGFSIMKGQNLEITRLRAADPQRIRSWLFGVSAILNRDPRLIFNCDETFLNFKKDYRCIACGNKRPIQESDTATHMTSMICFNPCGDIVKAFIILPKLQSLSPQLHIFSHNVTFCSSKKGWITNELWKIWASHFVSWLTHYRCNLPKNIRNEKILLISDGHSSRASLQVLDLFRQENIELLILPAHVSHILQPFDVGIGGPLKIAFRKRLNETLAEFKNSTLSRSAAKRLWYVSSFLDAISISMTLSNCKTAFAKSGLYPYDPERPLNSPFVSQFLGNNPLNLETNRLNINGLLLTEENTFLQVLTYFLFKSGVPLQNFNWKYGDICNNIRNWMRSDISIGRLLSPLPTYLTTPQVIDLI